MNPGNPARTLASNAGVNPASLSARHLTSRRFSESLIAEGVTGTPARATSSNRTSNRKFVGIWLDVSEEASSGMGSYLSFWQQH